MKIAVWIGVLATLLGSALYAQDIAGDWQGTLNPGLRMIVKIARGTDGSWKATVVRIGQSPDREVFPVDSVTLQYSILKMTVDAIRGSYEGKISVDGISIEGTWTQNQPRPLELRRATPETAWKDPSPHTVQFVTVDKDVKLEVLDWGGSGLPLVLLTGLGNTAHVFDKFAPKLTAAHHVYGITRRGYGLSSAPTSGYSADRLGDDVLAVLDSLKLTRPVLVGHSIGGEELSSVGSRHPEKVAGLIYLDAGYWYAYYDRARGDLNIDLIELQKKLDQLQLGNRPRDPKPLIQELLETILPRFERDLREEQKDLQARPAEPPASQAPAPMPRAAKAIVEGQQRYTDIPVPILAIFAVPHDPGPQIKDPAARAASDARDEASTGAQAKAFESGLPTARVVRLPHASHYLFMSNEADVLREMNTFFASLH